MADEGRQPAVDEWGVEQQPGEGVVPPSAEATDEAADVFAEPLSEEPPADSPPEDTPPPRSSVDTSQPRGSVDTSQPRGSVDTSQPLDAADTPPLRGSVDTYQPRGSVDTSQPRGSVDTSQPRGSVDAPPPLDAADTALPPDSLDTPAPAPPTGPPSATPAGPPSAPPAGPPSAPPAGPPPAPPTGPPPAPSAGPPAKPPQPKQDLSKIIAESVDVLSSIKKRRDTQKQLMCQMSFILDRVKESIEQYERHLNDLVRFFGMEAESSELKLKTYSEFLEECTDYFHTLKDVPDKIRFCGAKVPLRQNAVKNLLYDLGIVLFADGLNLKVQMGTTGEVKDAMDDRIRMTVTHKIPFETMFELINLEVDRGDQFNNRVFELEAFIGFLKTGDVTLVDRPARTVADPSVFN